MSKNKKKTIKREKISSWNIHNNGSTVSGYFTNVPVDKLIAALKRFIPEETDNIVISLSREELLSLFYAVRNYLETHTEQVDNANLPECFGSCKPTLEKLRDFLKQGLMDYYCDK